ncbi:Predicted arabinose efflux permease, MFS family [Paenibacillus sp. UNCCL117]|uniref:MFS transporter n=1 Tax=unclassified Paenibacillus TaxID=185978 RepID=UPI0008800FFD|nr:MULTISPECIES: MFS transporter [unclassified Paenibacillus]SDC05999.1 Predicted arabinose efflux permease, MFS family [Paenibacillus sp. cl123]SFW37704.1 Predicted arabinose efflux permease, MFS family [Paenibacillus sp. UNCCL117]
MKRKEGTIFTASFIRLALILFFTEVVRSAFVISFLPAYAADYLGISVAAVGLAVSVHYVADTAVKAVAGYLLDRFPPKAILHISLAVAFIGLWLAFFSDLPWMLITGAALMGLGVSPIWLICLSSIHEDQRGSQMGTIYTVWLASLGLGPVAVNFVIDSGYQLTFWVLAAIYAAGWLVALRWNEQLRPIQTMPLREQLGQLKLKLVLMKPLVPGMILQTAAAGLLVPVLPTLARQHLGLTYSHYSLVIIAGGAVTTLCLIPLGRLSDRWGHKWFLVAGFGALAVGLIALLFSANHLYMTMLMAALLGGSYAAVLPAWNALMSYFVPPDQKGTGWGVLSSIEGIGVMIGPLIGGWVASRYDASITVWISAALLAFIAVYYFRTPLVRPAREEGLRS